MFDDALSARLKEIFDLPERPEDLRSLARLWRGRLAGGDGLQTAERLLSPQPTPHRVRWNGQEGFTWCVLDALMLPFLVGCPVDVTTTTPVERVDIRLRASTESVESSHPEAVVSLAAADEGREVRRSCCPYILAFTSLDEYRRWCDETPGVLATPLGLEQAWMLAADLTEPPLSNDGTACPCCGV